MWGSTRVSRVVSGSPRPETFCKTQLAVVRPINVNRTPAAAIRRERELNPPEAGATTVIRNFVFTFLISLHLHDEIFHRSHSPSQKSSEPRIAVMSLIM